MNAIAIQLVGRMRGILALYPGAVSIQCKDSRTWTFLTIGVVNNDAVFTLGLLLGLNEPKERRADLPRGGHRWWLSASAERRERNRTLVRVEVIGPHNIEEPPEQSDPDGKVRGGA